MSHFLTRKELPAPPARPELRTRPPSVTVTTSPLRPRISSWATGCFDTCLVVDWPPLPFLLL